MAVPRKTVSPKIDAVIYEDLVRYAKTHRRSIASSVEWLLESALRRERAAEHHHVGG